MTFLRALVRPKQNGDAGEFDIAAPAIGLFRHTPLPGSYLIPGASAGQMQVLNRQFELVIPDGVRGHIAAVLLPNKVTPVQYGQTLFRLVPSGFEIDAKSEIIAPEAEQAAGAGVDFAGMTVVRATTVGTFYRRPNPTSPPYADLGTPVRRGASLGLIEVMKVFNQVTYDFDLPGRIAKILVEDMAEVKPGQPLFLVDTRPESAADTATPAAPSIPTPS